MAGRPTLTSLRNENVNLENRDGIKTPSRKSGTEILKRLIIVWREISNINIKQSCSRPTYRETCIQRDTQTNRRIGIQIDR